MLEGGYAALAFPFKSAPLDALKWRPRHYPLNGGTTPKVILRTPQTPYGEMALTTSSKLLPPRLRLAPRLRRQDLLDCVDLSSSKDTEWMAKDRKSGKWAGGKRSGKWWQAVIERVSFFAGLRADIF